MLVPYTGNFTSLGRNVLIGWAAAERPPALLHDALLLREPKAQITLLTVERAHASETQIDQPLVQHLERHRMIVTPVGTVHDGTISNSDTIPTLTPAQTATYHLREKTGETAHVPAGS